MSPTKSKAPTKYNIVEDEGVKSSVTLFIGTKSYVATKGHPQFDAIIEALEAGESTAKEVAAMFDVSEAVSEKFADIDDPGRVQVKRGKVYMDGKEVHDSVTTQIVKFNANKLNFKPLARFMAKINDNPQQHSRDQLFSWLEKHDFTLCSDGDFLAYKGVERHGSDLKSCSSGGGIVNGKFVSGQVPNNPGSVVEMKREDVTWDPRQGCSRGLHVGNFRYARSFASVLLRVKVNPADVVSVPTDSNWEKMRVCKYRVVQVVTAEDEALLFEGAFKTAKLKGTEGDSIIKIATLEAEAASPAKASVPAKKRGARKAPAKKPAPAPKEYTFPDFYEDFGKRDFDACNVTELRWLASEWAIDGDVAVPGGASRATKEVLVRVLTAAARKRRKLLAGQ